MNRKDTEKNQKDFFAAIMFRYLPYWPLLVVLLLFGLAGAWAYLRHATPMYESQATVLVKDENKGVEESNLLENLNIPVNKKIVENEIEVIRSRKMMKEVVKQLHLYAPVYEKRRTKAASAYTSSPVRIEARNPDVLQATEDIPFFVKGDKAVIIEGKAYPLHQWVATPYGELRFLPNERRDRKTPNPLFFRLYNPKDVTSALLSNLEVQGAGSKLSTIVYLRLKDEVPERGEDVLNRLVATYNETSVEDKNMLAANTLAFIEKRLQNEGRELDSIERRIQEYRSKKGVVNLSEQGKLFLENVGENARKESDVNMQLAVLDQVEQYVVSKDNRSGIAPSTLGVDNPVLSQLLQKLSDAELEYEKLRRTTAENNPMVTTVAREIEQIRPRIIENIRNQRINLQASKKNLNATSSMYNSVLHTIPQKERELMEISRQHTIKSSIYGFLLEKREQTAMLISTTVADSKIVDVAESSFSPVSPQPSFVYLIGVVVALCVGIGWISAKELLNKKILFRSEIEGFTEVPVVAEISKTPKTESLLTTGSKVSFTAEQFRQLRASIGLYGNYARTIKRILVTSSVSGEGKSFISTNLAMSIALASKRVVLIDLDIRNPKVSSLLNVSDKEGIAEFLEGTKMPEEIIQETQYPNLYVISAGGEIDDARELILNGKLSSLLTYLESAFDYIVMDTSPIDPVTDAYVFSDYCDITLFVVRHGYTPKTFVQLLDSNNKMKALKNPRIVFNDVKSRGFFKDTYGYGYGYGYQSVYRDRSSAKKLLKA